MAVLAPIPRARVAIAMSAKAGLLDIVRSAKRTSPASPVMVGIVAAVEVRPPCHPISALDSGMPSRVQDAGMTSPKLRIGSVARAAGLSPDAIRHYERKGLLFAAERTDGGYRVYRAEDVRRVRVIQAALAAGFTIDELARIFAERRAGRAPCRQVRSLAEEKLARVDAQLAELGRLRL